jgi:hypothetical protein
VVDLYSSADIIGAAAPGYSSGHALAAMEEVANKDLPRQYSHEWTDLAFQEKAASGLALLVFPLCILFVGLTQPTRGRRDSGSENRGDSDGGGCESSSALALSGKTIATVIAAATEASISNDTARQ